MFIRGLLRLRLHITCARDEKGHGMNSETMMALEVVRALQETWSIDAHIQPIGDQTIVYESAIKPVRTPIHQRFVHQIGVVRSQVPNRREMMDWCGRRLITWGWHLRMRYGSSNR